jgi:hypothetical protein
MGSRLRIHVLTVREATFCPAADSQAHPRTLQRPLYRFCPLFRLG